MTKKGLVAFFDILGYQDIIDNNLIEEVAKIVSDTLLSLPSVTKKELIEGIGGEQEEILKSFLADIQHRVISDSILLVYEVPEDKKKLEKYYWLIFAAYICSLLGVSFAKGLPLRGAIDYGEFFLDSNCFAGKPIIDCYRLSNCMEFSGCVLTAQCGKIFQDVFDSPGSEKTKSLVNTFMFNHLVPLKGREERLWTLFWTDTKERVGDVRQYVTKAFQAHNKDVSRKVYPKLNNTEIMIRCFMERAKALIAS